MLLSSLPVISEQEEELKPKQMISRGEIPSPINIPSGCSFHLRCPQKDDAIDMLWTMLSVHNWEQLTIEFRKRYG